MTDYLARSLLPHLEAVQVGDEFPHSPEMRDADFPLRSSALEHVADRAQRTRHLPVREVPVESTRVHFRVPDKGL